jgi:hypothetical protein
VRYREEKPGDLDTARAEVTEWREQNPQGTPEQLTAAIGYRFHPDYVVVLRGVLFAVDRNRARMVTGIIVPGRTAGAR